MSSVRLVRIVDRLPPEFEALRAEARAEGYSMLDTLAREWQASTTRFARAGEALLSVYAGRALAGIGGATIEPVIPKAFRMRRFDVRRRFRRDGVGQILAAGLIDHLAPRQPTILATAEYPARFLRKNAVIGSLQMTEENPVHSTNAHPRLLANR